MGSPAAESAGLHASLLYPAAAARAAACTTRTDSPVTRLHRPSRLERYLSLRSARAHHESAGRCQVTSEQLRCSGALRSVLPVLCISAAPAALKGTGANGLLVCDNKWPTLTCCCLRVARWSTGPSRSRTRTIPWEQQGASTVSLSRGYACTRGRRMSVRHGLLERTRFLDGAKLPRENAGPAKGR